MIDPKKELELLILNDLMNLFLDDLKNELEEDFHGAYVSGMYDGRYRISVTSNEGFEEWNKRSKINNYNF